MTDINWHSMNERPKEGWCCLIWVTDCDGAYWSSATWLDGKFDWMPPEGVAPDTEIRFWAHVEIPREPQEWRQRRMQRYA